ncbi:MFS transporter [Clostridium sp.]|uniref:MFS transporter n=1 Tax=Clostridium sp. TaxID=1506 RepID=UPI001D385F48|nr:MFS transporter [Clostridium sp.]MBS5936910.1 MFS transporter [Clostridium sp.]
MNKRINIYLLNIIVFLQGLVFYAPIATIYRENRGISISQIFLIESIYMILIILLEIPWGIFADKYGYKKTLVLSNLIFFISKIVFFKADSFSMFLLERFLLATAISGLSGCDSTVLYLSLDKNDNSEKAFAKYGFFSNVGFLLGSVISTFIINISIDLSAYYTIIPYGLAFIISLFLLDVKGESKKSKGILFNIKEAISKKEIIILILGIALVAEVVQSITVFLNQGIYIRSGIDIKYFGIMLAGIQIIGLISVKSYKITKQIGQRKSILLFMICILVSSLSLVFIKNPILSFISIAVISTSMGFIEPIFMDIQNKSIKIADRATILSIYSIIGSIVSAIVSPIIGSASNASLDIGIFTCFIITLIAITLININYKN